MRSGIGATAGAALAVALCGAPAQAGDLFSNFFGMFGGRPHRPPLSQPFINEDNPAEAPRARANYGGGGAAWCVRTCEGHAIPPSRNQQPLRQTSLQPYF